MQISTQVPDVTRDLASEDYKAISALAKLSFPTTQASFVTPGKAGGLVIERDGKIVAVALLRIIRLPSGRKVGFVAWLMTHPDYCGQGLASKLVVASTERLTSMQCEFTVTDVEGYNTGSANAFFKAGYGRVSLVRALRQWSAIDSIWLSIKTGHLFDPGHFLWVSHGVRSEYSPWRERLLAFIFNALIAVFAFALGGGFFSSASPFFPSIQAIIAFFIGVFGMLIVREVGVQIVATLHKVPLEFRAWTGGWGVSFIIAMSFGNMFPLPGNVYPRGDGWRLRNYQEVFGQGAVVSTLFVASLIMLGAFLQNNASSEFLRYLGLALLFVGKPLMVFDTLVAVAPFEGFNGRHLRDYNRFIWIALSAIAVILFVWA